RFPAYCLATAGHGTPLEEFRRLGRCACSPSARRTDFEPTRRCAAAPPCHVRIGMFPCVIRIAVAGERPHGRGYPMPARGDAPGRGTAAAWRRARSNPNGPWGGED